MPRKVVQNIVLLRILTCLEIRHMKEEVRNLFRAGVNCLLTSPVFSDLSHSSSCWYWT